MGETLCFVVVLDALGPRVLLRCVVWNGGEIGRARYLSIPGHFARAGCGIIREG